MATEPITYRDPVTNRLYIWDAVTEAWYPSALTTPSGDFTPPGQRAVNNGAGTTSLVFGIFALVIGWVPIIGLLCAFVAILAGCVGIGNANRGESTNKGSAVTGLVFGCVNIGISVLFIIYFVAMMNAPH